MLIVRIALDVRPSQYKHQHHSQHAGLLDVPHGVDLADVAVCDDLHLVETPVRVLFPQVFQGLVRAHMEKTQLRVDRVPDLTGGILGEDVHLPEVLGGHGDVVVDVAGDLLVLGGGGGGHVVRIKSAVGHAVDNLLLDDQLLLVLPFDVGEGVAGHLLQVQHSQPSEYLFKIIQMLGCELNIAPS